jgi:hypothetical protein
LSALPVAIDPPVESANWQPPVQWAAPSEQWAAPPDDDQNDGTLTGSMTRNYDYFADLDRKLARLRNADGDATTP